METITRKKFRELEEHLADIEMSVKVSFLRERRAELAIEAQRKRAEDAEATLQILRDKLVETAVYKLRTRVLAKAINHALYAAPTTDEARLALVNALIRTKEDQIG